MKDRKKKKTGVMNVMMWISAGYYFV